MLILKRNWGDFKAVYKARRAFRRWKNEFAADRAAIQASRTIDVVPERLRISILWQYYVKGRKTFDALPK